MLQFAFLILVAGHRQSPTTVTYTNNGARIEVIFPELSKLTGRTLSASPELAGRVLVLRLDHASVDTALGKIASSVLAKWQPGPTGELLVHDPAQVDKVRQAAIEEYAKRLQKAYSHVGNHAHYFTDPYGTRYSEPQEPIDDELKDIVASMDPHDLARVPAGQRIVYSNRPTALQRPLPVSTPQSTHLVYARHGKFDVAVWVDDRGLHFEVTQFDDAGHISYGSSRMHLVEGVGKYADEITAVQPGTPLEVSKLAKEYSGLTDKATPPPDLALQLNDPLKYDPDSFMGEYLVAYAKAKGRQLVAAPTDLIACHYAEGPAPSIEHFWDSFECEGVFDLGTLNTGEKDGWITISDSCHLPDTFLNRQFGHADALFDIHRDRRELAQIATYSEKAKGDQLLNLVRANRSHLFDMAVGRNGGYFESGEEGTFVKLLSAMTDDEIAKLRAGNVMVMAAMSSGFQKAFAAFSGSSECHPWLEPNDDTDIKDLKRWRAGEFGRYAEPVPPGYKPFRSDDIWQEYTEVADSFVPPNAIVHLIVANYPDWAGPGRYAGCFYKLDVTVAPHILVSVAAQLSNP